ncbi:MAG: 3-hydroxyacyl-CoA dehydrogenase family protein, partial [Burkholderiaceae bacterium]
YSRVGDRVVELGRLGQKTGKGWYRYEAGDRTPQPDAAVSELVAAYRSEIGMTARSIPDDEIVQRCVYALVNEGARILEEGIAMRASDIDVVYLTGYGFPAAKGGPMFYAQMVGLNKVVASMREFARNEHADPKFWQPARLLLDAAQSGKWPR